MLAPQKNLTNIGSNCYPLNTISSERCDIEPKICGHIAPDEHPKYTNPQKTNTTQKKNNLPNSQKEDQLVIQSCGCDYSEGCGLLIKCHDIVQVLQ